MPKPAEQQTPDEQIGTPTDGQTPPAAPAGETTPPSNELPDWAKAKVSEANSEAAGYRVKLREAEQERDTALAEVDTKVAAAVRDHLIELHNISADDAELFLTGTDAATLTRQALRLNQGNANTAPHMQGTPETKPDEQSEFLTSLFGGTI